MAASVRPSQIYTPRSKVTLNPVTWVKAGVKLAIRATTLGLPIGHHMSRFAMYHHIAETLKTFRHPTGPKALVLSRSDDMIPLLGRSDLVPTIGEYPEYDLLDLSNVPESTFDYLLCDQVLEHLKGDPRDAFRACYHAIKPGGIAVLTTCMLQEIHGGIEPNGHRRDYWRFTPNGLELLAQEAGFIRIEKGGWGNRLAFAGLRYMPVPKASWHPIHKVAMMNQPIFPIVTWAIVQK